jgi:hypothetical protein
VRDSLKILRKSTKTSVRSSHIHSFSLHYTYLPECVPDSTKCLPLHLHYICLLLSVLYPTLFIVYWKILRLIFCYIWTVIHSEGFVFTLLPSTWFPSLYLVLVISCLPLSLGCVWPCSYVISSNANSRSAYTQRAILSPIF